MTAPVDGPWDGDRAGRANRSDGIAPEPAGGTWALATATSFQVETGLVLAGTIVTTLSGSSRKVDAGADWPHDRKQDSFGIPNDRR